VAGFSGKVFISKRTIRPGRTARQNRARHMPGKRRANGAAGKRFENENDFKKKAVEVMTVAALRVHRRRMCHCHV
jgi:hypothetical protein